MMEEYFDTELINFPLDALIIEQDGEIIREEYVEPFDKNMLHRMFSVAKSYTSLAVGALYAEGKLNLPDRITNYFPEYKELVKSDELRNTTIENLLLMRTPYAKTTYKMIQTDDWVKSFFEVIADHAPGMIFQYDTSAAVVLGALVKRISGKGVLDYLREVFLKEIGFSDEAYMLKTPSGDEHTGSGLMAYPRDLLVTGEFLLSVLTGDFCEKYNYLIKERRFDSAFWDRYISYLREAMSYHSATVHTGKTRSECCGYGYQFWMLPKGGVMMYGMGGQYLLFYPEKKTIIVTTADTQSAAGGTQWILDEAEKFADGIGSNVGKRSESSEYEIGRANVLYGTFHILIPQQFLRCYTFSAKELVLEGMDRTYRLPYSEEGYGTVVEWSPEIKICARGELQKDGSFYIHARFVGECLGAIHILLCEKEGRGQLYLRCVEETALKQFNGFFDSSKDS
jgi:CubicO group peptidase (beta-lactamase class C family)